MTRSNQPPNRILICGYGSIGERHHRVLSGLFPSAEITVCTRREIPLPNVIRALTNVNLKPFDFFVISSETINHFEQLTTIDSQVQGKCILVEKPLFEIHHDYQPQNQVFVGYNMRFNPMIQRIRTLIQGKKILAVNVIAGQYLPDWRPSRNHQETYSASKAKGGGVLLDLSHEVDYLNWMFGPIQPLASFQRRESVLKIDSDEHVLLLGQTGSGALINCTLSYLFRIPQRKILIEMENESIEADLIAFKVSSYKDGKVTIDEIPRVERDYSYQQMHTDLLLGSRGVVCSYSEGVQVMKTIDAFKAKTQFGK